MNKRRLTMLRDALIEHAKNPRNLKFDLRSWTHVPDEYRGDVAKAVKGALRGDNFCGTAACAMGLAAALPQFKRAGLKLSYSGTPFIASKNDPVGDYGFAAAISFFNIGPDDAFELFSSDGYVGDEKLNPLAVADKITALLECA